MFPLLESRIDCQADIKGPGQPPIRGASEGLMDSFFSLPCRKCYGKKTLSFIVSGYLSIPVSVLPFIESSLRFFGRFFPAANAAGFIPPSIPILFSSMDHLDTEMWPSFSVLRNIYFSLTLHFVPPLFFFNPLNWQWVYFFAAFRLPSRREVNFRKGLRICWEALELLLLFLKNIKILIFNGHPGHNIQH